MKIKSYILCFLCGFLGMALIIDTPEMIAKKAYFVFTVIVIATGLEIVEQFKNRL